MTDTNDVILRNRQIDMQIHTVGNLTEEQQVDFNSLYRKKNEGTVAHLKSRKTTFFGRIGAALGKSEDAHEAEILRANEIKEAHYAVTNTESFNNISDQITLLNFTDLAKCIEGEALLPNLNKDYKAMLDSIRNYITSDNYDDQQENLGLAMDFIDKYLDKHGTFTDDPVEASLVARARSYKTYFASNTNGNLQVVGNREVEEEPATPFYATWSDASKKKLFPHEPSVNDIRQRGTEDCYMLSTLSSIAYMRPEMIRDAMIDNGDGTVTVRLYDEAPIVPLYGDEAYSKEADDIHFLKKLFSSAFQNKELLKDIDELENVDKSEDLADGFEIIDDVKTVKASSVKNFQSLFASNNEEWYDSLITKLLANDNFKEALKGFKALDDEKAIVQSFYSFYKDNSEIIDGALDASKQVEKMKMQAVNVTVTKKVAKVAGTAELYATDSLWVQMIEKAYAIKFGNGKGYKGIAYGQSYDFIKRFTGVNKMDQQEVILRTPKQDENEEQIKDEAFNYITTCINDRKIVTVGVDEPDSDRKTVLERTGIRVGHAYSLLNTFEKNGKKFVTLRDPYAVFKREYEEKDGELKKKDASQIKANWKDGEGHVNFALKLSLKANDSNGIFNMEFNDFLDTFNKYLGIYPKN